MTWPILAPKSSGSSGWPPCTGYPFQQGPALPSVPAAEPIGLPPIILPSYNLTPTRGSAQILMIGYP